MPATSRERGENHHPAAGPLPYDMEQKSFAGVRDFGGAIANAQRGIELALQDFPDGAQLPDYNLDGDRGYAWPCWDVHPESHDNQHADCHYVDPVRVAPLV